MGISASPNIVQDGLTLMLDAADRNSYPGTGTTWYDMSGTGRNGIFTNGPSFSSVNGGYISFDGTDDYVQVDITSTAMQTSGPLTLCAWVYRNGTNNGMIFSAGGYYGLFAGGTFWYWNNSPNWVYYFCPGTIPSNQWYHYCLTYNNSTNPIFYINGVAYTSTGTYAAPSAFGSSILRLGEYSVYLPYSPFNGRIASYNFYNRALSASEVLQNYNALRTRFNL